MKLNRNQLKTLAIIAMTVDHIALAFLAPNSLPYYFMRLFGRLTAPIMTFLLTEGYRHTRSKKQYFKRLVIFAGISQPVYFLFAFGRLPQNALEYLTHWNVLYTLAIGLAVMALFDCTSLSSPVSIVLLGCLISLAHFGDWSYLIPAWTIIFFCYYQRNFRKAAVFFILASAALQTLLYAKQFETFALFSFQFGTLFALIPISMYNGQRGNVRHKNLNRWFFYIYYPVHMVLLLVIQASGKMIYQS